MIREQLYFANLIIIDEKHDMSIMPIEMCKLTFDIHEFCL